MLLPETLASWQGIQDSLAGMSGLELGLYGAGGELGRTSGECPFCTEMRATNGGRSLCREQCSEFARAALDSRGGPMYYKCWLGLKVFACGLKNSADGGLALVGGKTFESKEDYESALERLKKADLKVQATGRHRYRFVGKKRLDELVGFISSASEEYFSLVESVSRYRLRSNRQSALLETAGVLYRVSELGDLVDGFMRTQEGLFGLERISIHVLGIGDGERDRHFVRGGPIGSFFDDPDLFVAQLRRRCGKASEPVLIEEGVPGASTGLAEGAGPAVCVPAVVAEELVGFVCIYKASLSREDTEAFRGYVQQIAAAIDNRRLRTGVLEKLKQLKAMSVLYSSAGSMQDPDEICRLLLEKSTELMKAERGSLMMINERTDELFVKFSKGISEEVLKLATTDTGSGIAGHVARTGAPVVVRDADRERRPGVSRRPEYKTGSFVSVPLKVRGRVVGVVNLTDKITGRAFDDEDMEFLLGLASHAGNALERSGLEAHAAREPEGADAGERMGLQPWRVFMKRLEEECERSRRYGRQFSLMVMDMDGFAEHVLAQGKEAGDEAARRMRTLFVSSFRLNDTLSVRSEKSFTALLPEAGIDNAVALANRIRRRVEAARFPDRAMGDSIRLTISIGVAVFPEDADRPGPVLEAALAALRQAAAQGGNKVCEFRQVDGTATA